MLSRTELDSADDGKHVHEEVAGAPPVNRPADGAEDSVPIIALRPSDSPRLAGEDGAHVRLLAQSEETLPPILVHRPSMRVIDGMHRLEAAILRGEDTIRVRYFDGDDTEAFVLAVKANVSHGLPLTMADRRAAALRIIGSHPEWSDRAIAGATGLSAKTVGGIRKCATGDYPHLRARVGRDGRTRPLSGAEGRLRASALMREKPTASMRQIAAEAGISLGTVRDVRDRLARGEDPVPRQRGKRTHPESLVTPAPPPPRSPAGEPRNVVRSRPEHHAVLLHRLKHDPSLRFNEAGRALIRLLSMNLLGERDQRQLLGTVPEHCRQIVADLACACASMWWELAAQMSPEDRESPAPQGMPGLPWEVAEWSGRAAGRQELGQDLGHLRRRRHGRMMRDGA